MFISKSRPELRGTGASLSAPQQRLPPGLGVASTRPRLWVQTQKKPSTITTPEGLFIHICWDKRAAGETDTSRRLISSSSVLVNEAGGPAERKWKWWERRRDGMEAGSDEEKDGREDTEGLRRPRVWSEGGFLEQQWFSYREWEPDSSGWRCSAAVQMLLQTFRAGLVLENRLQRDQLRHAIKTLGRLNSHHQREENFSDVSIKSYYWLIWRMYF